MHSICLELFKFKFCKPHKEEYIALKSVVQFNIIQKRENQTKIGSKFQSLSIQNNQKCAILSFNILEESKTNQRSEYF